jgi:hypothetical protein
MKFTMSDSRAFTNWGPNCSLNADLQAKYIPNSSEHDFRLYLQRNAEKIMKDLAPSNDAKFCPVCQASLDYKPGKL